MFFQNFLESSVLQQIEKENRFVIQYKQQYPDSIFLGEQEYCLYLKKRSIDFLLQYSFANYFNKLVKTHGLEVISSHLIFLPVLKGGVYLESSIKEFSRLHFIPNELVGMQSYKKTMKKNNVLYLDCAQEKIENKHLILLDEVIDSGETLQHIVQKFLRKKPASINLFVAINKLAKQKNLEITKFFQSYGVFTTAIYFPHNLWAVGTLLGLDADQMCRATLDDLFIAKSDKNWLVSDKKSKNPYTTLEEKITAYQNNEITGEQIGNFIDNIEKIWYV